jgi:hypothetical protein
MNERIQELALFAGMFRDKYGMYFAQEGRYDTDGVDLEKFAELIVEECILIIQRGITRDGTNTEKYLRSMKHIKEIREHFGVENDK